MGEQSDEDQKKLLLDHPPEFRRGGHITIPIILVNDACERVASVGLGPNMVFYLMNEYHLDAASASIVLSVWSAFSNGLAIVGAFLADSYLGRFRVIALGSISSLSGTTLIWLTAMIPQLRPSPCEQSTNGCNPPGVLQLLVLFCSFGLISIGAGCLRPCSMAFGIDQVDEKQNPNSQRAVESFINWYNGFIALGAVFTLTVIVYIQDNTSWKVGFAVSALFMAFSAPVFLLSSSLYVKVKTGKSLLTGLLQVIVAALKNRNNVEPLSNQSGACYHQGDRTRVRPPTDNLGFLNKACIIKDLETDLNPDGSASNPWSLCTVQQVEEVKNVLRVIPIWSTSIVLQGSLGLSSFATLQAKTMHRQVTSSFEIPAAALSVVSLATILIGACVYECLIMPLLVKCTAQPRGLSIKTRMTIGLVATGLAMAVFAVTELIRRNVAIKQGVQDDANVDLDISVVWLVPQFVLAGMAIFFYGNGLTEYLYTQFSKKMGSVAIALYTFSNAAGGLLISLLVDVVDRVSSKGGKISWLASNINKGRLDYFYWLLCLLNVINLVYFYVCWWGFGLNSAGIESDGSTRSRDSDEDEEQEEINR